MTSKLKYIFHYRRNFALAYPVVLSQIGQMAVAIADNVMVGQIGALPLAACSFANSLFINPMMLILGVSIGLTPLVGEAQGTRDGDRIRRLFRHGLLVNGGIGLISCILLLAGAPLLAYMGQTPEVTEAAIPYFKVITLSMLPLAIFFALKQFNEGISSTKPAMYITIAANLVNIGLNYVLIYGKFGAPALGLMGAGYATLVSRIVMAAAMLWFTLSVPEAKGAFSERMRTQWALVRELLAIGLPIGGQIVMEVASFSMGAVMIGWIGPNELAAHQIALSLAALAYMIANGLSAAATIRASNYLGTKDIPNLKLAVSTSYHLVLAFMGFSAIVFAIGRYWLPALHIDDWAVIDIAARLMIIACVFQLFDGLQVVAIGALRGMQDVKWPTFMTFIAYWGIGLPCSYVMGFIFDFGVDGVWFGFIGGLGSAGIMLTMRIRHIFRTGALLKG